MKTNIQIGIISTILNTIDQGIIITDNYSDEVIFYNDLLLDIWKIEKVFESKEQFIQATRELFVSPDALFEAVEWAKNNPEKRDVRILTLKGNLFIERRSHPMYIDEKLVGRISYFKDVTSEILQKSELINQNALLETIISSIPYSVFWKDRESNYLGANLRFARDAGKDSPSELIGKNDYDMPWSKPESDSFRAFDKKIMESGQGLSNIEETQKNAKGEHTILLTSKVPLKNKLNEVIGILGIYTDITEFKNNQKLVKEQELLLVSASQMSSLGEMAGGIAHEINNPLSIIKASTHYLKKNINMDKYNKENFLKVLKDVDDTVDRIAKIIMGLRNISHSSNFEKSKCCFRDVMDDVLILAREKFKFHGIELRESTNTEALNLSFDSNRIQLSQVLINLLNNAFDAIEHTEVSQKWIEIQLEQKVNVICLMVTDCGDGIPAEVRDKMFNPFYTTKKVGKGTGIGLSISKTMMEKLGGKLFYNESSKNTQFVVEVPLLAQL